MEDSDLIEISVLTVVHPISHDETHSLYTNFDGEPSLRCSNILL